MRGLQLTLMSWTQRCPGSCTKRTNCRAHRSGEFWWSCRLSTASKPPFCALSVTLDHDYGDIDHGLFPIRFVRDGLEQRRQTSAFIQSRKLVQPMANKHCRSPWGLPEQFTTPSPRTAGCPRHCDPRSPGSPRQRGAIFAHRASVATNLSIRSLNRKSQRVRILDSNTP
jgi:hypothetical protein